MLKFIKGKENKKFIAQMIIFVLIRAVILAISCYMLAFVVCASESNYFYFLIIPILVILIETIYFAVWRRGREINWFVVK